MESQWPEEQNSWPPSCIAAVQTPLVTTGTGERKGGRKDEEWTTLTGFFSTFSPLWVFSICSFWYVLDKMSILIPDYSFLIESVLKVNAS